MPRSAFARRTRTARFSRTTLAIGVLGVAALGLSACSSGADADKAAAAENGVTTVTVATSGLVKPYTFVGDDDELTGYDIETLRLVDEKLDDIAFDFQQTEFEALFAGLDSGRFDAVANNLSTTEERKEKYDFTIPYIEAQFGIIAAPGGSEVTSIDDLAGKKTYGQPGLNYTKILEAYNENHPDAQIEIEYTESDLQTQYNNLAAGAVDFIFNERVVYSGYAEKAGLDLEFTPLDGQQLSDEYGTSLQSAFAFSRAKDQTAIVAEIDGALQELLDDGTLGKLSEQFFDGLDVTPKS